MGEQDHRQDVALEVLAVVPRDLVQGLDLRRAERAAGVVHQDVDGFAGLGDLPRHARHLLRVREVGTQRPDALLADLGVQFLRGLPDDCRATSDDHHLVALGGVAPRRRESDAGAAA